MRDTSFIIEEESWSLVEYDHSSVPGIIYLSLTEEKLNSIYDDAINNIADTDKLAKYEVVAGKEKQIFMVGGIVKPTFTITKNGKPIEAKYKLIPENKKIVKFVNGTLTAIKEGETTLAIQLIDYPEIYSRLEIVVGKEPNFSAYLEGADSIRLGREFSYKLIGTSEISEEVSFSLSNTDLAFIIDSGKNNLCRVKANDKNKIGSVELKAVYQGIEYTKEIKIIPLW